jgi:hypothetical protein
MGVLHINENQNGARKTDGPPPRLARLAAPALALLAALAVAYQVSSAGPDAARGVLGLAPVQPPAHRRAAASPLGAPAPTPASPPPPPPAEEEEEAEEASAAAHVVASGGSVALASAVRTVTAALFAAARVHTVTGTYIL